MTNDVHSNDGMNTSGSDEERWRADHSDAMKIRSAIKRSSSMASSSHNSSNRVRRARSPGITSSGSPPNENAMFTVSHARRMVKSEKESGDWKATILSPRTAPVVKNTGQRRTTLGDQRSRETSTASRDPVRLSTAITGSGVGSRDSFMVGEKAAWR